MYLWTLFILSTLSIAYGQDRKITPKLNPDCEKCSDNTTLFYIKAQGSHDTIHQLWDFTKGTPTVIYAVAGVNSTLTVEWKDDKPVSFEMSEKIMYSFGMAVAELYEYNDLRDVGEWSTRYRRSTLVCPLRDVTWSRRDIVETEYEAMLLMTVDRLRCDHRWRSGTVNIKLDMLPYRDFSAELPHLIHTANSSLVDISLVNVTSTRQYNASRYALRLVLVSTDDSRDHMHRNTKKSLDDEHTPGVFEVTEIRTPKSFASDEGGWIQFRPVAYTEAERGVTTSTVVHVSDFNSTQLMPNSTLYAFYRNDINTELLIADMVVSFGEPGDGFYRQHNYTAWTFTMGYGAPPVETFSLFVVLVISIGLGVPVVLALSGVVFVVVRRCRQRNAPARFTNDE